MFNLINIRCLRVRRNLHGEKINKMQPGIAGEFFTEERYKLVKEFPFFLHVIIEPLHSAQMRQHEMERADVFILLFIVNSASLNVKSSAKPVIGFLS